MVTPDAQGLVGILDSAELTAANCSLWLSAEEIDEYSALPHLRRKKEWLAGRVAAKFVFLERERFDSGHPYGLRFERITADALEKFSSRSYIDLIVSRDKSGAGGPARIGRRSSKERTTAAISHVNGLACALIGDSGVYSVDLEVPSPRIAAFYVHNFTTRERDWTGACARLFNLQPDWLYTLLWSVKECLLKTHFFANTSLWNMSSIEVSFLTGSERLKAVHEAASLSGTFELLRAQTLFGVSPRQFQLAVGGTANLILAAITTLD